MHRLGRFAAAFAVLAALSLSLVAGCSKQQAPEDNPNMSAQEKQDRADKEGK